MGIQPPSALAFLLAIAALTTLGGCAAVVSKGPVGAKPAVLDPENWEGTWVADGDSLLVQAIEPEDGVLQVSWIETSEEKPELKTIHVYIRDGDEWTYASYRDLEAEADDEDPSYFYWGRILLKDGFILAWPPAASKFEPLVKAGKLPGVVSDDSNEIVLKKLEPGHYKMIESEAEGVLFHWDAPMILRRISDD